MTYAQILEIEDCNVDKVYFYKEGMFLKAYEHSAFLVCRYIHDFKVSRRRVLACCRLPSRFGCHVCPVKVPDGLYKV